MSMFAKGFFYDILKSIVVRSGSRRDKTVANGALQEPLLSRQPTQPATDMAVTAASLYHLDQNIGFENAGKGVEIEDQAMNDLFESICDPESRSVLLNDQSTWQSLYSAHSAPVAPTESRDSHAEPLEDADIGPTPEASDSDGTMTGSRAPAEEAEAAYKVDATPAKAEADAVKIDATPMEAEAGAAEADLAPNEKVAADEGTGAALTEEALPSEPNTSAMEDIVEVSDFDPERDVIGVFYSKAIDVRTGMPVIPKIRISDNADGSGHIISLDGCDVARVIGAKHLSEDQIELIGE